MRGKSNQVYHTDLNFVGLVNPTYKLLGGNAHAYPTLRPNVIPEINSGQALNSFQDLILPPKEHSSYYYFVKQQLLKPLSLTLSPMGREDYIILTLPD